ncbi:hypothetical protein CFP65_1737 [Kitasatospora sp. MMS16-BH015]|uniref:hypothetical protein n=1 Tax=Kitasatospora sp. MMS16-BH015 TaxID=2018025 RepID=UPI000CA2D004|nr:hypothetical protein [Kitasatospora sp. MMS16-BH015]AUG76616.1 hypothetical protein CFP65_1737 [Kitasatospora sp. MMS16-BH015]
MATSRALRYLESARNLVGCGLGAGGVVLHFTGVGGPWWPTMVAALYGAGALLAPGRRDPWQEEIDAFAARATTAGLPAADWLATEYAALRRERTPEAERRLRHELPLALDSYLRTRAWEAIEPTGTDPVAVFRETLVHLLVQRRGSAAGQPG